MDSERVKLIVKFLEQAHLHNNQIQEVEFVSDESIQVNWCSDNQRNNVQNSFSNLYHFNKENNEIGSKLNDFPLLKKNNISSYSPNRTYKAIIQSVEDKTKQKFNQILEVYRNEDVIAQLNLSSYHQQIFDDPSMSSTISWNKEETKILYMAQVKSKSTKTYFEVEEDKDLEEANSNYQLNQNYGEAMSEITQIHLFEYSITNNILYDIQLPDNIFPCYPQYLDDQGEQIILQGYRLYPEFKYGIQVQNRYVDILHLFNLAKTQLYPSLKNEEKGKESKKKADYKKISEDDISLMPNLSYDGKKIAYYGGPMNPTHLNYLALKIIHIEDWTIEEILPIKNDKLVDKENFLGVCNHTKDLKKSFWMNDNKHYTFSSQIGPSVSSYIVNTETKQIARFNPHKYLSDEFQVIHYNPKYNALFASHVTIIEPKSLVYFKNLNLLQDVQTIVQKVQYQQISLTQGQSSIYPSLRKCALQYLDEQIITSGEASACLLRIKKFDQEAIPQDLLNLYNNNQMLNPLNYKDEERPLIVDVHGGPHATYGGEFTITNLYSLLQGYNILLPNFTGSGGQGQEFINNLMKNIGDVDAKEVINMIDQVIDKKICNPHKIVIIGGSYGGYLAPIIASKYSERFLCSVIANPVLNIPFMLNITDIPDWCIAESLGKNMTWNLNGDDYKTMFEQSPMSLVNKVPTLNLVGASDKRVPHQQSIAYHAQNIFNGNQIETYIFPNLGHAIVDHVNPIFDVILKSITFIEKYLIQTPR